MCGSDTVLIEFSPNVSGGEGKRRSACVGYVRLPSYSCSTLERYVCTVKDWDYIYELKQLGADIQINAASVTGDNGWGVQRCVKALLKDHVVDYVASDAHDTTTRTPQLQKCYKYIVKKYGVEYADRIMKADVVEKFS